MKKLLLILLCLPMIGFGQKSGIIGWSKDGLFAYRSITDEDMRGTVDRITIQDIKDNRIMFYDQDGNINVDSLLSFYNIIARNFTNNRIDDIMHLDCLENAIEDFENDNCQIIGYHRGSDNELLFEDSYYVILDIERRYVESGGDDMFGNPIYIYYNEYYGCKEWPIK